MKAAVFGAHTALARALFECLEEREIAIDLLRFTTDDHLDSDLELFTDASLSRADLWFVASVGGAARAFVKGALKAKKIVVDLTGARARDEQASFLWPGIDAAASARLTPGNLFVIASGLAAPIVASLRALAPAQPARAFVVTAEATAAADQEGMDELSEQTRARFSSREAEWKIFEAPIAFGTIPSLARTLEHESADAADDALRAAVLDGAHASMSRRIGKDLHLEPGLPALDLSIVRTLVPTFSAESATVLVDFAADLDAEVITKHLADAPGLRWVKNEVPSALDAIGRDDALIARVRIAGPRATFWIASDRLRRGSATLGALLIEPWAEASKNDD